MRESQNILRMLPGLILLVPILAFAQQANNPPAAGSANSPQASPTAVVTPVLTSVPSLTIEEYQQRMQRIREELNEIEVESEKVQHKVESNDKFPIQLTGGSLEQDFESNSNSWSILQGQTLHLKFLANPVKDITGHLDMEFWGFVAQDLTQFSDLPTLANQGQFFAIREMDATFDTHDFAFTAFKGMGFGGYYYTHDDLYYLFPDAYDVDKPFRVSGNAIPLGMSIKGERDFDGLEIWAGPELQWGAVPEAYLMYQHKIGPATLGVLDRVRLTNLGQPNLVSGPVTGYQGNASPAVPTTVLYNSSQAPTNTTELYLKVPIVDVLTADGVVMYSPNNLNQSYTYVQNVAPGTGVGGTSYQLYTATTTQTDALGYQVKLTSTKVPLVDSIMVNGEYSGVLVGDLERVSGEITEVPAASFLITADATVQKPLIGPNPTLAVGPSSNPIAYLLFPRGQYDPFRVTKDPISGINNREMTQFSLSLVFNPGNGWFFRYNPNNFGEYNVNTDLDTPFSIGVIGTLFNYPTGTDLFSYVSGSGQLTWEGPGALGQAPTNGYQPYGQGWVMWKTGDVHWILGAEGGFSQSGLSYNDVAGTSFTDSFSGSLSARVNNTTLRVGYGVNNWGPEDWNRQFGQLIGQQYLAQATQKFGNSSVSAKYVRWDNYPGSPYQFGLGNSGGALLYNAPLPLDEVYVTYMLSF